MQIRWFFAGLVALLLLASCESVAFVDRLEIVNDTEYNANVDVRGERGGWLGLATVSSHDTYEVRQVIDQGTTWTFSFRYGSHDPLELTMSKEELIDTEWRVEVPIEFEESLRAEGVSPPP